MRYPKHTECYHCEVTPEDVHDMEFLVHIIENRLINDYEEVILCQFCSRNFIKKNNSDYPDFHLLGVFNYFEYMRNQHHLEDFRRNLLRHNFEGFGFEISYADEVDIEEYDKEFVEVEDTEEIKETEEQLKEKEEEGKRKKEEENERLEKEEKERMEKVESRNKAFDVIDSMIGMNHVKDEIQNWIIRMEGMEKLKKKTQLVLDNPSKNILITGNPGVGKTLLASKLPKILFELGIIEKELFYEYKAEDLVAKYLGQTAEKTKEAVDEALGSVFFLDEAYRLSSGFKSDNTDFGLEAIETIMGYMDKPDNKTVFIFAGYPDKMDEFIHANDGLRSRIKSHFELQDYTLDELKRIGLSILISKGYNTECIEEPLVEHIKSKMQQGILEGNGRTINDFINKIIDNHMIRISSNDSVKDLLMILPEDVEKAFVVSDISQDGLKEIFADAKNEINKLIGMNQVKREIDKIANFQYIQNKRKHLGLKTKKKSHHMVLLGNPGTGKTTLARLLAHLFRGAGVLSNGHFVEATKEKITSGGSIPKKVKSLIAKAKGGILFIDEAYTLTNDMKGKEALDALIPYLENNREDFICILGGYVKDMKELFALNEGLSSRIPYHFYFTDYTVDELIAIANVIFSEEGYKLDDFANETLKSGISLAKSLNLVNGNARWVRNVFEQVLLCQSERLMDSELDEEEEELSESDFIRITTSDITNALSSLHPGQLNELISNSKDKLNLNKKESVDKQYA